MDIVTWYQVHGIIRRSSTFNTGRILHLYADRTTHTAGSENIDTITLHTTCSCIIPGMILHYGDLTDASSLVRLVTEVCGC